MDKDRSMETYTLVSETITLLVPINAWHVHCLSFSTCPFVFSSSINVWSSWTFTDIRQDRRVDVEDKELMVFK